MYRKGDILLISVNRLPENVQAESSENSQAVLAYGEATGHAHMIEEGARIWVDVNDRGRRYLEVTVQDALVRHQEHGVICLKGPQVYEIIRQREYTPQEVRVVRD